MKFVYIALIISLAFGSLIEADTLKDSTLIKDTVETTLASNTKCIAVLDFTNLSAAPNRIPRLIAERIRLNILNNPKFRTIDAGQTWKTCGTLGHTRNDSLSAVQIKEIGNALQAEYLITGLVVDYHEGDIEFKKRRIELIGKLYDCRNGKIISILSVKSDGKSDINQVTYNATEKLAQRLIRKIPRYP